MRRGTPPRLGLALAAVLVLPSVAQERGARPQRDIGFTIEPVRAIYGHLWEGPFQEPAGVFFDRLEQELFVCDLGGRRIAIADGRGFPTYSFGSASTLRSPRHLAVDADGRIYVADSGHPAIRVFDYDGESLPDLTLSPLPEAERPLSPAAIALRRDGRVVVLDKTNRRVIVADLSGRVERVFGAPPGRQDLLLSPVDLDLTPEGQIAISDRRGLAVQIYEPSGRFVRGWGQHEIGASEFSTPAGIAVDGRGRVFVADTLRQDVKIFTPQGEFLTNFGGFGTRPGQLLYPVDVASDGGERIFVSERVGRRVQVFRVRDRKAEVRDSTQRGE